MLRRILIPVSSVRANLRRFSSEASQQAGPTSASGANLFDIRSKQFEGRSIYMDFGATTPLDFRVLDAMMPFMTEMFGNPHSRYARVTRSHHYGWETEKAIELARERVANVIGADPKEIIFTSGATESNNLALRGLANFYGADGGKRHIITTQFVGFR